MAPNWKSKGLRLKSLGKEQDLGRVLKQVRSQISPEYETEGCILELITTLSTPSALSSHHPFTYQMPASLITLLK